LSDHNHVISFLPTELFDLDTHEDSIENEKMGKVFATVLVLPTKFHGGASGKANAPEIQKPAAAG
jgi:hypothetical protein